MNTLALYLLGGASLLAVGFYGGFQVESWRADAAQLAAQKAQVLALAKAAEDARALGIAEGQITVTSGSHFADIQTKIVTRTITQIREVPKFVTVESDRACVIPRGFIRLHDNAARGVDADAAAVPDASAEPNDASTTLALSAVTATVATNYGRCNANAAQLDALNDWIRKQQELHK